MFCQNCGKEATGKFCVYCGNKIEDLATQNKKTNKVTTLVLTIIRYIIGIFIGILCFGAFLSASTFSGILLFIAMGLVIPFSSHFVKTKLNIKVPKLIQAIIIVFLFFIAILNINPSEVNTSTNNIDEKADIQTVPIKNNKLIAEQKKIEKVEKYYKNNDLGEAYLECKKIIPTLTEEESINKANDLFGEISSKIPTIKATTIAKEYKDNEVKADLTYKNKFIRVTGILESIGKVGNSAYITLSDGNKYSLSNPQFSIDSENEALKVAELKEGDSVSILCKCTGATLGTAMFKNCIIE